MAGIATIAKESNMSVTGCDQHIYPPMSTLLDNLGIDVTQGYAPDLMFTDKTLLIGNALSRGNAAVEYILDNKLPYTSGPQWLYENVLRHKTVMAVAGTHGKTSTASMLAWILHVADKDPGFLIGGKPGNFEVSARLGKGQHFIIEADEYDTAFFDKRSKFLHYHPYITVLNNLEFDHADIFADLAAIKTQFHHLIRTLPSNGRLIVNADDENLKAVLDKGVWTPVETFSIQDKNANWYAKTLNADVSHFQISRQNENAEIHWTGLGEHNMSNALAAVASACQVGVSLSKACQALSTFIFPNKRLQRHVSQKGFILFEDFAHHPTAIEKTLSALRKAYPKQRIVCILELRSNTMRSDVHQKTLAPALLHADLACVVGVADNAGSTPHPTQHFFTQIAQCLGFLKTQIQMDDVVVVMSNGDFYGLVKDLMRIA